ncbi:MAG: DUF262 domain-containing protein [Planctomycetes bacterium]|nr:DUF262 domain-containing protein [Planctomycetota bacterium]
MSFQTPITIAKAIENIQSNQYILPAIQREFVWSDGQIERLFDSLMRGYPIGSFLFWRINPDKLTDFQFYRFMNKYHQRDHRRNEPITLTGEMPRTAILDGQQRLTALNIGLNGYYASKMPYFRWNSDHAFPKRRLYLNLLAEPDEERDMAYEFKMLQDDDAKVRDDNHFWFRVGQILQFDDSFYVIDYCNKNNLVGPDLRHPSAILHKLWKIILDSQVINHFLEEEHNLEKVLNIFIRVNSGGTQLSYSDILLSIAVAQWQDYDAREEIYSLVDELNQIGESFTFNKDFILKSCLVLSDVKSIAFKIISFNKENMQKIEENWNNVKEALDKTVRLLSVWGYSRDTLVSNNAIIPLAYYILRKGNPKGIITSTDYSADRERMQRWLMRALLKRTFGGQSDNVLTKTRRVIAETSDSFPEDKIYESLRGTAKSMAFDEDQIDGLLDTRYGHSGTFTVLALLYPWLKFDQHFHIDHIFPRSMFKPKILREKGIPKEKWNLWLDHKDDLGNLQLLQGKVNMNKADKDFEAWLQELQPEPVGLDTYKQQHIIPELDLSFWNFPEFLEARTQILRQKLKELLEV